jgi:GH15 family glucan-1,4-alpha-glucosidase
MVKAHKYDMGIIGNCAYLALINSRASVSWLCWPRFDSSPKFGSLLDEQQGGDFQVASADAQATTNQYYVENTNVLVTEFHAKDGVFKVIDFAPRFYQYERFFKPLMLFRKIERVSGNPKVIVNCDPKDSFNQASSETKTGSNHIRYEGFEQPMRLTASMGLTYILEKKAFTLTRNEYLALSFGVPLEAPLDSVTEEFYHKTVHYWRNWVQHSTVPALAQQQVIRSSLVLKLHQYEDTGAIIASATTSLPESPGSGRNWDYRYCWMRDTFYTLAALRNIGHGQEMAEYAHYIENLPVSAEGRYQPLYSISTNPDIDEKELPLRGYQQNGPVRVGNQAREHIQNDVYGQILVSLMPLYTDNRFIGNGYETNSQLINNLLNQIEKTMDEPDAGLWEFRNISQQHCYTFLFHWAGAKAAIQIGKAVNDDALLSRGEKLVKLAEHKIEQCYDPEIGAYYQAIGNKNFDASLLQLITMNYLDPGSEKAKSHLQALEKELKGRNGLFFRYKHEDDFGMPETTFLICAFWYVEALACVGRLDEAIEVFEELVQYGNHLGLLSEDVHEINGSQWGNFPQAYSHVGLMNAAFRIARKLDKPEFL